LFRKYEEALEFHQQAELLCPQNPSTYSAIAYCHALMGNYASAVDCFHKVTPATLVHDCGLTDGGPTMTVHGSLDPVNVKF
jgi:tetratricopeptide (TPR) repeat protein